MGTTVKHPVPDQVKLHLQFLTSRHSDLQS